MSSHRSWVPVLGREKGRIFAHHRPGAPLELVDTLDFSSIDDRASDAPGRVHESVGHSRHAMEPPNLANAARHRMAKAVAQRLAKGVDEDEFDQIFVVAAPDTLGALREHLLPRVQQRIVGESNKNLDNADLGTIAAHLDADGTLGHVPT